MKRKQHLAIFLGRDPDATPAADDAIQRHDRYVIHRGQHTRAKRPQQRTRNTSVRLASGTSTERERRHRRQRRRRRRNLRRCVTASQQKVASSKMKKKNNKEERGATSCYFSFLIHFLFRFVFTFFLFDFFATVEMTVQFRVQFWGQFQWRSHPHFNQIGLD